MNEKGYFGFIIVLALITLLLYSSVQINQSNTSTEKTKNELIKAEQANKERTITEYNLDRIIETKLNEQVTLNNFNTQTAKNSINSAIINYLKTRAKVHQINSAPKEITTSFMNQNSTVAIMKGEFFTYAEYVYSPNTITANIIQYYGNKITSEFTLPQNYTTTILREA